MIKQKTRKASFKKDNLNLSGTQPHNSNQILLLTIILNLGQAQQLINGNQEARSNCADYTDIT